LVRDHQADLQKHLKNNFVTLVGEPEARFGNKIAIKIKDSEYKLITIEANQ